MSFVVKTFEMVTLYLFLIEEVTIFHFSAVGTPLEFFHIFDELLKINFLRQKFTKFGSHFHSFSSVTC